MNKKQSEAVHTIVGNSQRHQIIELMLVILHIYNVQYKLVLRTLFFFLSFTYATKVWISGLSLNLTFNLDFRLPFPPAFFFGRILDKLCCLHLEWILKKNKEKSENEIKISNNKKIFTFSNHWFFAHCTNEALIMPSKFFKSNEFGISKTTFSWKIEKKKCRKRKKINKKGSTNILSTHVSDKHSPSQTAKWYYPDTYTLQKYT